LKAILITGLCLIPGCYFGCIRSRKQTNCDTLTGHLSTAATLIGNVALRTRS